MKRPFCGRDLSLELTARLMKCYVLTKIGTKKIQAFETWMYRTIPRIPWTERITKNEMLIKNVQRKSSHIYNQKMKFNSWDQ